MSRFSRAFKQINKIDILYAVAFSIMCVFSRHVIDEPADRSTILTTYVTSFGASDIFFFALSFAITLIALQIIRILLSKVIGKESTFISNNNHDMPCLALGLIIFGVTLLSWIPYLMSYWPGGIYNDTLDSINIALRKAPMDNQNTVLYALWWRFVFFIGSAANQGDYGGLKLMTVLQPVIMAGVAAFFLSWLYRRGCRLWIVIILASIFAFTPIFPFYAVSLWKDTLFSVNLFIYTWLLFVIVRDVNGGNRTPISRLLLYVLVSLLIIFGRNNGIYIVMLVSVMLCVYLFRNADKKESNLYILVSLCVIIFSLVVQGPVYKAAGVIESDPVEKYGIPLQQTAYMISSNADISDSERELLEGILPIEGWINLYDPIVVDTIKFDPMFNTEFFNTHTREFVSTYYHMVTRNPLIALRGYLLSTIGFWDAWKSSSSAYICISHCSSSEYFMSDYFNLHTGLFLSDIVGPRWYISSGLLVWIMIFSLTYIAAHGTNKSYLIPILPVAFLWITLLIATPVSYSFRYVFSLLLCMPIYLICIIQSIRNNQD